MNVKNFKTVISATALTMALAASGSAFADSSEEGMLNMKADANVENRSADKAANFNVTSSESESDMPSEDARSSSSDMDSENSDQYTETDQYQDSENYQAVDSADMSKTLHFQFDSTELTEESQKDLEQMKDTLADKNTQTEVKITGYTDATGPEVYNQYLSEERAKAIKASLESTGLKVTDWSVKGEGESSPIADNDSREGRAENRRVEINVSTDMQDRVSSLD